MDIRNRADIEKLVNQFYEKVKKDETIGYIFTDIVQTNWEKHLPVMYNFWDTIILDANNYHDNAMGIHFEVNKKEPLLPKHFTAWIKHFTETVDELFKGEKAEMAKKRAVSIAALMEFKMGKENDNNLIEKSRPFN